MKKYCFKNHCGFSIIDGRLWTYYKGETINDKWVYILLMNQRMQFMPFRKCFYISANWGYLCYLSFGLRGEAVLGPLPLPGAGPSLNPQHSWHREASCRESLATALRSGVSNAPPPSVGPYLDCLLFKLPIMLMSQGSRQNLNEDPNQEKVLPLYFLPLLHGQVLHLSHLYLLFGRIIASRIRFPFKRIPP